MSYGISTTYWDLEGFVFLILFVFSFIFGFRLSVVGLCLALITFVVWYGVAAAMQGKELVEVIVNVVLGAIILQIGYLLSIAVQVLIRIWRSRREGTTPCDKGSE
ncbi:hypothetical protein [Microvirga sp. VF16]|uniref:hypothetical protein n=1 Tax=Microvirga sp. VF16 TaxID=2807101 RepID=UPI00193D7C1A|nr:hypothetical protein [Microvirga sp. VF16]QRM33773.1 hypothetical protein JO965_37955 [Microvirga sp. VF16]